jgi:CheY-like chemotaxis protein
MVNAPGKLPATTTGARSVTAAAQKVVVVNGSHEVLELLEAVLDAGRYDVVFVDAAQHAYSQIRRMQPNLVILCVRIEDLDGFQVLSMLKMDPDTRSIPVLTYTTEFEGQEGDGTFAEPRDEQDEVFMFRNPAAALRMN